MFIDCSCNNDRPPLHCNMNRLVTTIIVIHRSRTYFPIRSFPTGCPFGAPIHFVAMYLGTLTSHKECLAPPQSKFGSPSSFSVIVNFTNDRAVVTRFTLKSIISLLSVRWRYNTMDVEQRIRVEIWMSICQRSLKVKGYGARIEDSGAVLWCV